MGGQFSQPVSRVVCVQLVGFVFISLMLVYFTNPGESCGATSLQLTTTVDNKYVNSSWHEERYLEVLVQAPERSQRLRAKRPPLNISLVLDRSGSMEDEQKLFSAIKAVWGVVLKLGPEDHFSLITYDGRAEVVVAASDRVDIHQIRFLLDRIDGGGRTNLSAGLLEGYRQVERYYSPQRINRVMLFSDGQITEGIRSSSKLNDIVLGYARDGISLTTFGMGHDFNENLMASLSESGRGMYYFIDRSSCIEEMLAKEFTDAETLVAQNIKVEVDIDERLFIDKVFANKYEQYGNKIILYGGDLAAGKLRRFQIRLRTKPCGPGTYKMAQVEMTYIPVGLDRPRNVRQQVALHYQRDGSVAQYRDAGVSERTLVFKAHYARSRAAEALERGDVDEAQKILDQALKDLRKSGLKTQKLREQKREVENYAASLHKKLDRKERSRIQKAVKYDRHMVEGC